MPTSRFDVYDRFGLQLREGDQLHCLGKTDVFWKIQKITPIVDPRAIEANGGMPGCTLRLVSVIDLDMACGLPIAQVLRTLPREALEAAQQAQAAAEPPAVGPKLVTES